VQSLNDQAGAIQQLLNFIYDHAYKFLAAIAAVGTLSMAVIQTIKDMLPVRNWFQRFFVRRWLRNKAKLASKQWKAWMEGAGRAWFAQEQNRAEGIGGGPSAEQFSREPSAERAEEDLIKLATDGDGKALYELQIEQLCGQLNAAAQVALDRPRDHSDLMRCLASLADPVDVARVMFPPLEAKLARTQLDAAGQQRYDSFVDARTRVTHQVQRAIDALQINAGFRWKFYLQLASILLSGIFAGSGVAWFLHNRDLWDRISAALVVGILGGFLAPVARDLVASVQQLRK
jgi:hypothetical protein